jgi:hypothetical protein
MDALPLTRHDWHGDWNYTLRPEDYDQAAGTPDPFDRPSPDLTWAMKSMGRPATGPETWRNGTRAKTVLTEVTGQVRCTLGHDQGLRWRHGRSRGLDSR